MNSLLPLCKHAIMESVKKSNFILIMSNWKCNIIKLQVLNFWNLIMFTRLHVISYYPAPNLYGTDVTIRFMQSDDEQERAEEETIFAPT